MKLRTDCIPEFRFASRRSPVYAPRQMVAASQPLAVAAGLELLDAGGNAADAAVAVAAVLAVVEPCSTGLGGDAFVLFHEAGAGQTFGLNGSGRSPRTLTRDAVLSMGFAEGIPQLHALTVTVPGACGAWCDLAERFGKLGLARCLQPAIRLASEGFVVGPVTAQLWKRGAEGQLATAPGGRELTLDGRAPRPGERFVNKGLAGVLEGLAKGGKGFFYQGDTARRIAAAVQGAGGLLAEEDLAAHGAAATCWTEPLSVSYGGYALQECPPNGQGIVALIALNILKQLDREFTGDPQGVRRFHLMVEALRQAFGLARSHVADPDLADVPVEALLSESLAQKLASAIRTDRCLEQCPSLNPLPGSETVYFCTADSWGNACSMVNSNYMGFGTGIVPAGLGFSLQNRGANFSWEPDHPNCLGPGKRPFHTIIPAMLTDASGRLAAAMGVMGAFMQPQGHLQVLVNLLDHGLDPQAALDLPRFCLKSGSFGSVLCLEEGVPEETAAGLAALGHRIERTAGYDRALFGRGQVIIRDQNSGGYCAGSDPRADGLALGR